VHTILACYAYARHDSDPTRIGIVVGRRTGKAAARNRVRRRLREAARHLYSRLAPGYDVVLTARAGAEEASFQEINDRVLWLFGRAGLLESESNAPAGLAP
jgi:ribonuclease P protein component